MTRGEVKMDLLIAKLEAAAVDVGGDPSTSARPNDADGIACGNGRKHKLTLP